MALELKLNPLVVINDTCSEIILNDDTGSYDAGTNPGGYGAPNPEKSGLALLLRYRTFTETNEVDQDTLVVSDNPSTVDSWAVSINIDKYYEFSLLTTPIWDGATSYVANQIVYYDQGLPSENGFYKALVNNSNEIPPFQPSFWETATNEDVIAAIGTDPGFITSPENLDYLVTCNIENCFLQATAELSDSLVNGCATAEDCGSDESIKNWQEINVLYNSVLELAKAEKYLDAQKVLAYAAEVCESLDCGCGC